MRDLNGRLDRLAEFVAEGRISVRYALERARALTLEDRDTRGDLPVEHTLIEVARAAREQAEVRFTRVVNGVVERLSAGSGLHPTPTVDEFGTGPVDRSIYVRPETMGAEILRDARTPLYLDTDPAPEHHAAELGRYHEADAAATLATYEAHAALDHECSHECIREGCDDEGER